MVRGARSLHGRLGVGGRCLAAVRAECYYKVRALAANQAPGRVCPSQEALPCVRDSGRPVQVPAVLPRLPPTPGDREDRLEPELRRYQ